MNNLKNLNIDDIVAAVIADDTDAAQIAGSLKKSLLQAQAGEYSTAYTPSPIAQTRHKTGLSQSKFADSLNISVHTLKSWESGKRKPSGAAAALLKLLEKHPDLIAEL
ncbi:type II toxin-antitoxin system MqsA family antitoxin [Wielerella bovis]|uniref:helix-turn-helix domain-containing protein n=1 Tax=Wielerella bovis TaxID=2917790 RepID=UPI0020184FC2|nr:type II toxin-antitoxin system MqsA family antitoxin [Wielerella bovis]ULJ63701.1 type II toxin-antitoxin system MqsA family antitoxin [Wielerella bovis]